MTGKDVDYGSGSYDVMIPANTTGVRFNVPIIDDKVLERDENFNLTITNISSDSLLHLRVTVINPQATVTIVDNDGKYYSKAKDIDK